MRVIIDYCGEKSFDCLITLAGNGAVVVAVAELGAAAATVISRYKCRPGW